VNREQLSQVAPAQRSLQQQTGSLDPSSAAIDALAAVGPDEDRADGLKLFGQFVGSWDVEIDYLDVEGNVTEHRPAEWHFGWVLEGRAIQDVLFGPPAAERHRTGAPAREYGSTIRMYDPRNDVWHVSWFAPVRGVVVHLAGGRDGDAIVLEGTELDGTRCRWVFSDITSDSFLWSGFEGPSSSVARPLVQRMEARRKR
jgi:hypothetical protein